MSRTGALPSGDDVCNANHEVYIPLFFLNYFISTKLNVKNEGLDKHKNMAPYLSMIQIKPVRFQLASKPRHHHSPIVSSPIKLFQRPWLVFTALWWPQSPTG